MADRPNILFIIADQHNAKILGHQGHANVRTPHLDRMAAEGVRCDNALTQNPICTPSRVSFLSGQYCHNHGYYGLSGGHPGGLPNIFGHFRRQGYTTAALGKIHCPEYWVEDDCDTFHETCGTSVGGRSAAYSRFLRACGKEGLEDHGGLPEFGERGRQSMEGRPSALTFAESQEGWIAAQSIEFMRSAADKGQPFLVHASLPRPHQCTSPSAEFWDLYEGEELALPPNADYDMEGKAPHLRRAAQRWRQGEWTLIEPRTFAAGRLRKLRGYLAAVSQVDRAVGQMLDFLRQADLADNTIVVYAADHGDYACEHGIMEKAPGICSDAITRVPCLWWGAAALRPGHVVDELVELVDIPTTLCQLAGVENLETGDGRDISPLLAGGDEAVRRIGVTEFAWSKSVRRGPYRLVHYPPEMFAAEYPDGFGELYDLEADPWEMTNLYFDPQYREVVEGMQRDLLNWLITTTRPGTVLQANAGGRPVVGGNSSQRVERYRTVTNHDGKIHPDLLREVAGGNYL
ncbi:MAG: sulfatase-like hydrolase/transferase [Candidatus Latescibacteria bacterium]|nr:sulfatase-like hydrolase/transferase [Candidatus Latescibacterota bacterium]